MEGVDETVTVALSAPTNGATLGTPASAVVTIDDNDATFDTTPIAIPGVGSGSNTSPTPAAPYPASIHVTGQPTQIGGVEVNLVGFGHAVPQDVDILLVGPQGQNVVLMSDVGGQNPGSGVNLTFSDAAGVVVTLKLDELVAIPLAVVTLIRPVVAGAERGGLRPAPLTPPCATRSS